MNITCELTPFSSERMEAQDRSVTYADLNMPGYDVYEITRRPVYSIKPDNLQFKIRVKNNQNRVLKLIEVPIILIVDGMQITIPEVALLDWKGTLIVKGFEKDSLVNGPYLEQLRASKVVYIAVHDVPVLYDRAGNVTRKDNFEWTFKINNEQVQKHDKILYTYEEEPIYKEQCKACYGKGYYEKIVECPICKGTGYYTDDKGNSVKCRNCGKENAGTGRLKIEEKYKSCSGRGVIAYPKSPAPPIASEVIWTGWKVRVETNPPGAKVSVVDINTGEYKNVGVSNIQVDWFSL